mgnify:CR=1 FL=1
MKDQFLDLINDALKESGTTLQSSSDSVAQYAADRAAHLSTLVGQPGFMEAVRAERDNVMLYGAMQAGEQASAADNQMMGLLHGALTLGAQALGGVAPLALKTAQAAMEGVTTSPPEEPEEPPKPPVDLGFSE